MISEAYLENMTRFPMCGDGRRPRSVPSASAGLQERDLPADRFDMALDVLAAQAY